MRKSKLDRAGDVRIKLIAERQRVKNLAVDAITGSADMETIILVRDRILEVGRRLNKVNAIIKAIESELPDIGQRVCDVHNGLPRHAHSHIRFYCDSGSSDAFNAILRASGVEGAVTNKRAVVVGWDGNDLVCAYSWDNRTLGMFKIPENYKTLSSKETHSGRNS